jgi:hypothetical protein
VKRRDLYSSSSMKENWLITLYQKTLEINCHSNFVSFTYFICHAMDYGVAVLTTLGEEGFTTHMCFRIVIMSNIQFLYLFILFMNMSNIQLNKGFTYIYIYIYIYICIFLSRLVIVAISIKMPIVASTIIIQRSRISMFKRLDRETCVRYDFGREREREVVLILNAFYLRSKETSQSIWVHHKLFGDYT